MESSFFLIAITARKLFFWLPSSGGFWQGYNTVGWLFHGSILLLSGTAYWNNIELEQLLESFKSTACEAHPQHQPDHAPQAAPPLTLTAPGKVGAPSLFMTALLYASLYFAYAGTKTGKVIQWTQPMNCPARGTTEATNIDPFIKTGKIGQDKAVPP